MRAIMAETTGASAERPRRALLDQVREADIFLLLLGPHYGEPGESGRSPTEDEYEEEVRLGKPILVLKQNLELDPEQEAFSPARAAHGRVRGHASPRRGLGPRSAEALAATGHRAMRPASGEETQADQEH